MGMGMGMEKGVMGLEEIEWGLMGRRVWDRG